MEEKNIFLIFLLEGGRKTFIANPPGQNSSKQKSKKLKVACNGHWSTTIESAVCTMYIVQHMIFQKRGKIDLPYWIYLNFERKYTDLFLHFSFLQITIYFFWRKQKLFHPIISYILKDRNSERNIFQLTLIITHFNEASTKRFFSSNLI